MTNTISRVSDFIIKVIMIFTTIVALVFFAENYPNQSISFGFIALVYVLAIITKGLADIFAKN